MTLTESVRVGVIGGGAAGIIAAKWLREAGHRVVVFEKASHVGGVWKYDEATGTDASMYKESHHAWCAMSWSLHTNLPTSVMQLDDFPFPPGLPSFPGHADVLAYLQNYTRHFRVDDVIRLNSTVTRVVKNGSTWTMSVTPTAAATGVEQLPPRHEQSCYEEEVDKLVVCNGHFAQPFCSQIQGSEHFHGATLHSHDYRTPEAFRVLLVGRGPSGQDISLELVAAGAKQVIVSCKESDDEPRVTSALDKRTLKPPIDHIARDGSVVFTDGSTLEAPDALMYCTGYLYSVANLLPPHTLYPSAPAESAANALDATQWANLQHATAAGHAVAPLYKQLFAIEEPDVALIGLPFKNLPFRCFELQAKWIARVFSGAQLLPSKQRMYDDFFTYLRELSVPVRKLHQLGAEKQHEYFSELAALSDTKLSGDVQAMFQDAGFLRANYPFEYRSAEYAKDPLTGKWTRTLKRSAASSLDQDLDVLVETFE